MAPRPALPLAALLLTAAAGAATTPLALWPDGSGHVHSDFTQHAAVGFGTTLKGYLSLGEAIGEVDVKTGGDGKVWVLVALLNGGFAIVDGTDPSAPVLVSKARGGGYGADAKWADDTNTAYMSLQGFSGDAACNPPLAGMYTSVPRQLQCGIQIWDTSNKAAPAFVATLPTGSSGSHMMDYEVLNGLPTVASAAQGQPNGVPIGTWHNNRELRMVGRADAGFNHDVTLRSDPVDNLLGLRSLAIVSNWDEGVRIYDITNPSDMLNAQQPPVIGHWQLPQGSGGHIHTTMPTSVEGKRVIVTQQENFGQSVVSKMWVLDATDYSNIKIIGTWQNPDGKLANNGFVRWSTHNLNIDDGKVYLAHYHGGLLVFDIGTLAKATQPGGPPLLANFLPAKPRVSGSFGSDVPYTWEAYPHRGVVWVTDINTGLYAVTVP